MKKKAQVLAALLLAVCLLAGCGGSQSAPESVPDAASAAPEGQEDTPAEPPEEEPPAEPDFVEAAPEDLLYEYVEELGGVMVYGYTGSAEGISIPAQLDGEPVVQIGDGAGPEILREENGVPILDDDGHVIFPNEDLWPVKRVELPEGVVTIANRAFWHSTELETVLIPGSVAAIETGAFQESGLKNITLPDSLTEIGSGAFMDCASLESAELPSHLSFIDYNMFMRCTSLKSILIPDGVDVIQYGAFSECTALESIAIPESVRWVGSYAFYSCTSLSNVTVPDRTILLLGAFYDCGDDISFTYRGETYVGEDCGDIVAILYTSGPAFNEYVAAGNESASYQPPKAQG